MWPSDLFDWLKDNDQQSQAASGSGQLAAETGGDVTSTGEKFRMRANYVIIGGGAAAFSAIEGIRALDKDSSVWMVAGREGGFNRLRLLLRRRRITCRT